MFGATGYLVTHVQKSSISTISLDMAILFGNQSICYREHLIKQYNNEIRKMDRTSRAIAEYECNCFMKQLELIKETVAALNEILHKK